VCSSDLVHFDIQPVPEFADAGYADGGLSLATFRPDDFDVREQPGFNPAPPSAKIPVFPLIARS
jgi:hypothetical protein